MSVNLENMPDFTEIRITTKIIKSTFEKKSKKLRQIS